MPPDSPGRRAVFLDRDGVLSFPVVREGIPLAPSSMDEFAIYPEAAPCCDRLHQLGYEVVVVTNQPDVARGVLDPAVLEKMHERLSRQAHVDAVYVCPHDDDDACGCRKPAPGLLLKAAADLHLDLRASFVVGERWRDVEAGRRAGCRTVHVERGYCERAPEGADAVVSGLAEAVLWIENVGDNGGWSVAERRYAIKIFADGADLEGIVELARDPDIAGFTTNPTLMRKAGVDDYEGFAHKVLDHTGDRPVSFEVLSDEFDEMRRQALRIASWGTNVFVKIPVTDTRGHSSAALVEELSRSGLRLNVTGILTLEQVRRIVEALTPGPGSIVSVFAGRIADTGRDPVPLMADAVELVGPHSNVELLWASPREILNVCQAASIGCDIITVTHDLLPKLKGLGRDLEEVSLETIKMFHRDAEAAGYVL